jgi:hypothetical protein
MDRKPPMQHLDPAALRRLFADAFGAETLSHLSLRLAALRERDERMKTLALCAALPRAYDSA